MTDDSSDLSRRTFMKGVGVAAGAAALGIGASGTAAASEGGFDARFANPRVREAAKVWESRPWRQGFRGRPDRTLAVNDSGIDVDHPDLGPWNGLTTVGQETDADGVPEIRLTTPDGLAARGERSRVGEPQTQTAVLGPGTTVEGSETAFPPFTVPAGEGIVDMDATLEWTPQNVPLPEGTPVLSSAGEDQSFRVELDVGEEAAEWVTLQTVDTGSNPEELSKITVVPGERHRFVAGQFANVLAQATVTRTYHTYAGTLEEADPATIFEGVDGRTPKTVGWFDAGSRYGEYDHPADEDGHGSHVSGIIAGSGRASAVDSDRLTRESPRAVLTAGETLSYEVSARRGTGVFGVATGEGVEVLLEGPDGQTLRRSAAVPPLEDARIDHPTVDEAHPDGSDGEATYTVVVRPLEGEAVSSGRVEEVAVGAFLRPEETDGDRSGGDVSVHSGVAPDAGLVGLQGLSGPAAALGLYGEDLAPLFNVRAVNMSWGGLVPGGGTVGGSSEERSIRSIAEAGVLTVAAAGNNFGTLNTAPAIADEAVSVAATDDLDGVTAYTDGGAQAQDEDGQGAYGKPDVCAPGGTLAVGARSVKAEAEGGHTAGVDGVRDYTNLAGTSMASPYVCGVAGVVAQAMEEGDNVPESIRLPSPKALHADGVTAAERLGHVLRLKQVLLGTASTTAFTAAPYHKHAVRYVHDGRDTYEGYGRVNPDAAVDALTRDLLAGATTDGERQQATVSGAVGLDVPADSRAVAGHVEVPEGTVDVSLSFSHYSGANKGMTKDVPWLDLFVYDAESPGRAGTPNTLGSAMGQQGEASVSVDVSPADGASTKALFVVAKLVNVPGVVNGYDVQAHVDLDVSAPLPGFSAAGSRADDGTAFTRGSTNRVEVTVESFGEDVDAVAVSDFVPEGWEVQPYGDAENAEAVNEGAADRLDLGTVTREDLGTERATRTYFVEATGSGESTFGPAEATATAGAFVGETVQFGGTDQNAVVGVDQSAPADSATDTASETATETTEDATTLEGTDGTDLL